MSESLKSCPSCGSNRIEIKTKIKAGTSCDACRCTICKCHGPVAIMPSIAVAKWNALPRHSDIERLEKEADWLAHNRTDLGQSCNQPEFDLCWLVEGKCRECWRKWAREAVEAANA